jgi:hypothetical protein
MKISHSKVELYNTCPAKYKFRYIDKLDVDKTFTPLLFGSAIDQALNYVLIQTKDKKPVDIVEAKRIFNAEMDKWHGQNELAYFKYELPEDQVIEGDDEGNQVRAHRHLKTIGEKMLDTYVAEILPLFDEVIDVQITKNIKNEEDDELILVVDFVAKLKDGRVVTFDNKTTGDVKKNYPKNSVQKSQQLSIYAEFADNNLAGYIAMQKKLKDDKIVWNIIVDEIPDEQIETAFNKVDDALRAIKREEFDKNEKGCFSFGKLCEYAGLCKRGSKKGLIERK